MLPNDKGWLGDGMLYHARQVENAARLNEDVGVAQYRCHGFCKKIEQISSQYIIRSRCAIQYTYVNIDLDKETDIPMKLNQTESMYLFYNC